jgi:hypothetical protein
MNMKKKMKQEGNEPKVQIEVANIDGHTALQLTQTEALDIVEQCSDSHWVIAGGRLVEAADLANADWADMDESDTTVQLVPQLVGGL